MIVNIKIILSGYSAMLFCLLVPVFQTYCVSPFSRLSRLWLHVLWIIGTCLPNYMALSWKSNLRGDALSRYDLHPLRQGMTQTSHKRILTTWEAGSISHEGTTPSCWSVLCRIWKNQR